MFDFILPFRLDQTIHLPRRRKIVDNKIMIVIKKNDIPKTNWRPVRASRK